MKNRLLHILCFFCLTLTNSAHALPSKKASLVIDLNNSKILHANNAHELRYPASLVKMMTLYLAFKKLEAKELHLQQKLKVSSKAASMPRTNLALRSGETISAHKAILGLIVHSSNDAAVVLAEAMAGSEEKFVKLMNKQAKALGMNNTRFCNSSGWHNKNQKSTAYDLAKLSIALKRDFPKFFPWFATESFTHNGRTYKSHNRVMRDYEWATGLKTGFTNASGFNLATTASKNGKDLVAIVLGGDTTKARDKYMISLLNHYFQKTKTN